MKSKTVTIDGEFCFTAKYAAELLGTTRKKVFLIAETEVTRLRRDPSALAEIKKASKMPAHPAKAESMPRGTVYKGDTPLSLPKTRSTVGNPLADEGKL